MEEEFAQAHAAIARGRDAIDTLTGAILDVAQTVWSGRWLDLAPRPITLSTWVGYDTDGRTDIGWWDTLRLRLQMKLYNSSACRQGFSTSLGPPAILERARQAITATMAQLGACPSEPEAEKVAAFAHALVGEREAALTSPAPLLALFPAAIAAADEAGKLALLVVRAGLVSHGIGLAHTHVRLNAAQLHNAVRQRLGIADPPEDPSRRRALFGAINTALDTVKPEPVDFGALIGRAGLGRAADDDRRPDRQAHRRPQSRSAS